MELPPTPTPEAWAASGAASVNRESHTGTHARQYTSSSTANTTERRSSEDHSAQPQNLNPHSRKRLLLQILNALNELSNHDFEERDNHSTTSAGNHEPAVNPSSRVQRALNGSGQYQAFRTRVLALDKELQHLTQTFRQFGSAGIISSSAQLRTRLAKVLFLFNLNASTLFFPYVNVEYPPDTIPNWRLGKEPQELEALRDDLATFLIYLHDFPVLTHEPLVTSILQFRQSLKHWAVSLQEFQGDVRNPIAERYLHDLCPEMTDHLESVATAIGGFIEHVVPSIRVAQQRAETTLVSLSGLAAFVSAVTATGIQVAYDQNDGPLKVSVNAFWFTSLVLSVASAVNSLLGLAWTQSQYRSPRDRVPWWISIWIRRSPFAFLIAALVAFSVGLALFTWASDQHFITCLLTTFFTGISLFSLLVVSVWFAFERSVFDRYQGERLLADIIADRYATWTERIFAHAVHPIKLWSNKQATPFLRGMSKVVTLFRKTWNKNWRRNTSTHDHYHSRGNDGDFSAYYFGLTPPTLVLTPFPPQPSWNPPSSSSTVFDRSFGSGMFERERTLDSGRSPDHSRALTPKVRLPPPGSPRGPYIHSTSRSQSPNSIATTTSTV